LRIPNLPPLQCLIAFESVSRHSSITRAAIELEITASAVSRQIVQLEQFLGRSLFIREHRRLKLTVTGRQYGEHVQELLKECSQVTTELMKARGRMDLTIGCASGVAVFWLAPRIADFMAKYPGIQIRIVSRDSVAMFSAAEFDIGIYHLQQDRREGLHTEHIFNETVFALCSPEYLNGMLLPPTELVDKTLLSADEQLWMDWSAWFEHCGVKAPKLQRMVTANHYATLVQMAVLGNGLILGWEYLTASLIESGALVRASDASVCLCGGYYLVWPADRAISPAAQLFSDWVKSQK